MNGHFRDTRTRHFNRPVPWDSRGKTGDAFTTFLKSNSLSIQDPQLRVYKDPQRLSGESPDLPGCRRTLVQHILRVLQSQDAEWHPHLWSAQSHGLELTHDFHHGLDDPLDLVPSNGGRIDGSRV